MEMFLTHFYSGNWLNHFPLWAYSLNILFYRHRLPLTGMHRVQFLSSEREEEKCSKSCFSGWQRKYKIKQELNLPLCKPVLGIEGFASLLPPRIMVFFSSNLPADSFECRWSRVNLLQFWFSFLMAITSILFVLRISLLDTNNAVSTSLLCVFAWKPFIIPALELATDHTIDTYWFYLVIWLHSRECCCHGDKQERLLLRFLSSTKDFQEINNF